MTADQQSARCPQCGKSFAATVRLCPDDGTVLEHEGATTAQLGKVLDAKYRLDAFLSHGGMGSVYRATHVMLGKTVAVKLINPELVTSPEIVRRFQREARAATALHHPNIVGVYDLGQTSDGTLYIAMEFVNGPSLKSVISSGGPVSPVRTIALLRQVASALSFAHRHNVIHRDLKPHNIMLATTEDRHEVPKLVDFGIAKTFDDATQLTMTGFALGTPHYMAPEQAEGRPVDARSDLYSLGVILYEMLSGDVPFNDTSAPAILIKHIKETPVAPSLRNPRAVIPAELETIALRCLEKDPARRFQSGDEFITALEGAAASIPGAASAMQPTLLAVGTPVVPALSPAAGSAPVLPVTVASNIAAGTATARVESPTAPAPSGVSSPSPSSVPGTRPTAIAPQGPAASVPAPQSSNRTAVVVLAVLAVLVLGGAGVLVYMKQGQERGQPAAASVTEPPSASPAMATQNPPQNAAENSTPAAQKTPSGPPDAASSPTPSDARSGPATGGSPTRATGSPALATAGAAASSRGTTRPPRAGVLDTKGTQEPAGSQVPAIPENPAIFFQCAGAPEVCSVLRTAVAEAIDKAGLGNVRSAGRADIVVAATVEGVQERLNQDFKTTFAVRNYSISLSGETTRTDEAVPMPSPTNVSFDPQFGSERVAEKSRLVASDLVDKVKAFTRKKRGG